MGGKLLEIKDLVVHFFTEDGVVKALDGVGFHVNSEETFALVGETGCGKSVTMLSVLGLIPIPGKVINGEVLFYDEDLRHELGIGGSGPVDLLKLSPELMNRVRGKRISLITQDPMTSLNPVYTSGNQIMEVLTTHRGVDRRGAESETFRLLESVALVPPKQIAEKYPHQLSGGERQRVVASISLAASPNLIIADEPTTNLDVTVQARILELLLELKERFRTSLIMITHDLGIVAETSDRVGVMYAGSVVELSDVFALFKEPLHPYTKGLLEAIPNPRKRRKGPLKSIPGSVPDLIDPPEGCRFHPRCELASEICREDKPELREISTGHYVACHHV
ncbi:MAG TPA: ABC transporter ATP-binding protein [Candidatus Latescibacteria bacterium]|nr:ABC transporter ATP-binding protein [Candidatus Latescibacterota bacterium]